MGLVEGVGDDVQEGEGEEGEAALEQHEAHLRHGRPGERGLHRRLGQHDEAAEQGRKPAHRRERRQYARRGQHHIGEADQKEPAAIDDPSVQQGRDRRRRLHHVDQPAVGRELGGLQDGREGEQRRRCSGRRTAAFGAHGVHQPLDIRRAIACGQQAEGGDQADIAKPRRHELLARRAAGAGALRIEQQQPVQAKTGGDPGGGEGPHPACGHQDQNARQRQAQPADEGRLPRLPVEIGGRITHHDPADEADQQGHGHADGVQPDGQAKPLIAEQGRGRMAVRDQKDKAEDRACDGRKARPLRDAARRFRPPVQAVEPGQGDRQGPAQTCDCDAFHRLSPAASDRWAEGRARLLHIKIHC